MLHDKLIIERDGEPWGPGIFLSLPRHQNIGGLFQRRTCWGCEPNHVLGFPSGGWLPGESLRNRPRDEYDVVGVRFPAQSIAIIDDLGRREFEVATGFVLGALWAFAADMRRVYIVLYADDAGRLSPKLIEPSQAWLKRCSSDS